MGGERPLEEIAGADKGKGPGGKECVDDENRKCCHAQPCVLPKVCGEERTYARDIIEDHSCGEDDKIMGILDEIDAVWDCEEKKWIESADYKRNTDCFKAHLYRWVKKDGFMYPSKEVERPIRTGLYYDESDKFWDDSFPDRKSYGRGEGKESGWHWFYAKEKAEIRKCRELQQEADPNYWDNISESQKNGRSYATPGPGRGWRRSTLAYCGKPTPKPTEPVHPENWYTGRKAESHPGPWWQSPDFTGGRKQDN